MLGESFRGPHIKDYIVTGRPYWGPPQLFLGPRAYTARKTLS